MTTPRTYRNRLVLVLAGLLTIRLIGLFVAPWGLHGDEAQYWAWSQDLDFGYFSKPPMIAWVIASTTSIFGNEEWAVRLAAPFLHIATSWMIFLTGRKIFEARIGFWAALIYTLMPAVWLSSFIISTDATLLLFWVTALHAWACLREHPTWPRAVQLGLAIGLGLLSKYAMAFFTPVLVLAVLFDAPTRKALLGPKGGVAGLIAVACLAPNLMWNAVNNFATISHTAENANLQQDLFNPMEVLTFWIDQLGVFGIVVFPMLILAIIATFKSKLSTPAKWLAGFAMLPLLAITLEALLSRANANWAVTAYGAAPILVALWAIESKKRMTWLKGGLAVQTAVVLFVGLAATTTAGVDALGLDNAVKRLRAWPETAKAVEIKAAEKDYDFIATDNRLVFYDLEHYGVGETPLRMWRLNATPKHHADLTKTLPQGDGKILLVSYYESFADYFREDFEVITPIETLEINLGPKKTRRLYLYEASGYSITEREDRT